MVQEMSKTHDDDAYNDDLIAMNLYLSIYRLYTDIDIGLCNIQII